MADPERNMIVVAVLLDVLEKFTSMLGKLNFIWATTVLLGGFASNLGEEHFLYVSIILAVEGFRIFGRRGELHTSYPSLDFVIKFYSLLIQDFLAVICLCLSLHGLVADHGHTRNQNGALRIFYWVSVVGSYLIVFGVLFRVFSGALSSQRKPTIVSYSVELLRSNNGDEQLNGARLLSGLVKDNPRALERLRSIGTIRGAVEMLVDMLNWDWNEFPELGLERIGIREAAADIISNLVKIGRNRTLVMAAPNSMESIASLLDDGNQVEINSTQNRTQSSPEYPYSDFSKAGLSILKLLANDHDNRGKMGSNRALLLKIITLIESNSSELHLKMLAIETLTSIARDQDFREIIGCIDGVLHNLFALFLMKMTIGNVELVCKAGEALGFLSLDNNQNCEIMKSIRRAYFRNLIPRLISLLNDKGRGTYAARILRNLSAYLEAYPEANSVELNMIGAAAAQVVDLVTEKEGVHQEAAIGLAAQIFKFLSQADYDLIIGEAQARSLISTLLDVLRQKASKELPNMRRFSILLLMAVMRKGMLLTIRNESQIKMDLRNALKGAMNTSVLESYSTLSGGLRSDSMAIPFLAQSAMELLDK